MGFELLPSYVWCLKEGCFGCYLCIWLCVDDVYLTCLGEFSGENCNPTGIYLQLSMSSSWAGYRSCWISSSVGNPGDYDLFNFCCIRDLFGFAAALITRVWVSCLITPQQKFVFAHLLISTRSFSLTSNFRIRSVLSLSRFLTLLYVAGAEYVHSSASVRWRQEFGNNLKINRFLALPKTKSLTNREPRQIKDAIHGLLLILNWNRYNGRLGSLSSLWRVPAGISPVWIRLALGDIKWHH